MRNENEKKLGYIPDPTFEDGFEGMYCGRIDLPIDYDYPPLTFDLRKADKHIRENGLVEITDEIKEMFKI